MATSQGPTSSAIRAEQRIRYNQDPHLQASIEQAKVLFQIRNILITVLIIIPCIAAILMLILLVATPSSSLS